MNRSIAAGRFKQECLRVLDEVARGHEEVIITKRGKPVARLVPVQTDREREVALLAELRGTARLLVSEKEFLRPSADEAGWIVDGDGDGE
ncbi:MAG: type II toxin-antitoxin system prevent-host-death family antitoxin [Myxococcales bacterium]|nr:type II toxin-antitoxin system prevent-host-death family antitoxin [Myxococcales bacterium]